MRYHIYHSFTGIQQYHNWDVDESIVRQIVRAFLRGETNLLIAGKKHLVGTDQIFVYENPSADGVSGVVLEAVIKAEAGKAFYSKQFFERRFKNVTESFLMGRQWGELKHDYYNVHISDTQRKEVLFVLAKAEVDSFLLEWSLGTNPIWIAGRRIDLDNPKAIKLFDIKFEWLSKDRGDIIYNIKKHIDLVHRGVYKIEALEHFGKDVTDRWDIKPYGMSKSKSLGFNWEAIHPEISRVSKPRFNSKQFADAVEAAFKELNDVIKKEYIRKISAEEDGVNLMRQAFKPSNPIFKLNALKTETEKNIQDGYMQIFAGAMSGIRNPKAHANIEIDEIDAWEKIVLSSHLMKMWDNRIIENEKSS